MIDTIINKGAEPVRWLIIAGIAYTLATVIWSFFATPVSQVSNVASTTQTPTQARPTGNVNWILSKHLFGEAGAAPVEVTQSNEPAIQTRLPLDLQSVFVADETAASTAIVAQRGKPARLYRVGDTLPGNAKLVEVLTDRIILRRAGVRETLMFPKQKTSLTVASEGDGDGQEATESAATARPSTQSSRSSQSEVVDTQPSQDPQEVIESYRERLTNDAAGTLNELGIETVDSEGSSGYRVSDLSQSPYLRQTGLQAGDIILSVNGRPVGDIQQDQLELQNIMAQGSARIEIQRGSRRFFITASLK